MRVALTLLRHRASGGVERVLDRTAAHLAEHGHDVTIVCRTHGQRPHPGVRFVTLRAPVPGAAWRLWAFARDVERHVTRQPYDLVYGLGHTFSQDVVRLADGLLTTHMQHALRSAADPRERWRLRTSLKWRLAERIQARALAPDAARLVIVNSDLVRADVLSQHDLAPEQVRTIPNGPDVERFHPGCRAAGLELRRSLGWSERERVVLFLGTGYRRKGLRTLLDAFACVARSEPGARLLVVGRDSRPARFETQARRLGLGPRVRFLGERSDPERCYGAADLYALPTFYDPSANTTLEALAVGLPVITTHMDGSAPRVEPGHTGAVIEPGDVPALAEALGTWLDPARAQAAREPARQAALALDSERSMSLTRAALEEAARRGR